MAVTGAIVAAALTKAFFALIVAEQLHDGIGALLIGACAGTILFVLFRVGDRLADRAERGR